MRVALVIQFCLIWFTVFSQTTSEPQIKFAYRYDFVDGEFTPVKRTSNSYDYMGNIVTEVSSWDAPNWSGPETVITREYNDQGLMVYQYYRYIFEGKVESREEIFRTYENSLLTLDSIIGDWGITVQKFDYSASGRPTLDVYMEFDEDGRLLFGRHTNNFWYNDSLLRASAHHRWDEIWYLQDSIYLEHDLFGDVKYIYRYHNSISNIDEWQNKFEYERDSQGRKTEEIVSYFHYDLDRWAPGHKTTFEYPDPNTSITTQFTYDEQNSRWIPESEYIEETTYTGNGRRTTSTATEFTDGSQKRETWQYDLDNKLVRLLVETKQITDIEWHLELDLAWVYDELSRILMSEYFYYDKEDSNLSHPYKRYYLREWKYEDFEDWIYYHEYENIYHSHLQSYIETSRITNRAYRCDGALLEHHWTWQSEGHFDQGKYSYEYYQDAWCDPQPTETSQIIIFPNPALEYAKFLLPEASANTQIRILDSSGKVRDIFTLQKSDYFAVDLAGFAPGIYIITADNGTSRYQGRLAVVK